MCQWYCTSEGPFTNLHCLHCHVRYCGACLHGEAGKMESLIKCAGCGKKPRIKANATRRAWGGEVRSPVGTSKTVLAPPKRGQGAQAYWAYKHAQEQDGNITFDAPPTHRSIFDKLTDPTLYTGSHRHRFDEEGRGRGLEGRDSVGKGIGTGAVLSYYGDGPVTSIAQLVRNDKLDPQHMNKLRRFPDGSSVLSPANRSLKSADSKWRPDLPRGSYPANNPTTYQRSPLSSPGRSPAGSPSQSPQRSPPRAQLSGSQSARSLSSPRDREQLWPHPHEINAITAQGRGLYGGNFAQEGSYAPQQRGPVGPYAVQGSPRGSPQQQQRRTPSHSPSHQSPELQHQYMSQQQQQRPQSAEYRSSPIFDKLTDPNQYTGTHRARFDDHGRGLGLAGRVDVPAERYQGDSYASPVITDLSQITRQQFNIGSAQGKTGHKFQY